MPITTDALRRRARIAAAMTEHDITAAQLELLVAVAQNPALTPQELATLTGVPTTSMGSTLNILSDGVTGGRATNGRDLIAKTFDPNDRRRKLLTLTPRGMTTLATILGDLDP